MDLYTKDNRKFDLGQFMHDQGKTLVGPRGRGGVVGSTARVFSEKHDVVYRVKDNDTGEESDFDAKKFFADQGIEIDLERNFAEEQARMKEGRKRQRQAETYKIIKENQQIVDDVEKTDKEKIAELNLKIQYPLTYKRLQKEMKGEIEESELKMLGTIGLDVASNIGRYPIAVFEAGLNWATGGDKGRPFLVSLGRTSDYGADIDPDTGNEETLAEHLDTLKEAMRVDKQGVLADLAIESGRDPLMGATLLTGGTSAAVATSIKGTKTAATIINLAKKYKRITAPAVATTKYVNKVRSKLAKSNVAVRAGAAILGQGVEGGIQGVITNYLTGENKNKLNTFIIEGVEEGIFGGMMFAGTGMASTLWSSRWNSLSKKEQKNALTNKSREIDEIKRTQGEEGIPVTPEELYNTMDTSEPTLEDPENAVTDMSTAEKLAAQDAIGMVTPITSALPAGQNRKDVIKKRKNVLHETEAEKKMKIEHDANAREAKKDINEIKKQSSNLISEINTAAEKADKEAREEITKEDEQFDTEQAERDKKHQAQMDELQNPTKATSFETWKDNYGATVDPADYQRSYTEFRKAEQALIDATNNEISPKPETETEEEVDEGPQFVEEPGQIELDPVLDIAGDGSAFEVTQDAYVSEKQADLEAEVKQNESRIQEIQSAEELTPDLEMELVHLQERQAEIQQSPEKQKVDHQQQVQKAVSAGKEIAPEVAEAYPDMKPKSFDSTKKDALKAEIQSGLNSGTEAKPETAPAKKDSGTETAKKDSGTETATVTETKKESVPVKLFDESKLDEIVARINKKTRPGRLHSNPMFDPELWVDMVHVGGIYVQKGINNFVDWSRQMGETLGDNVKPYLRSVFNALNAHPKDRKFDPELAVKIFEYGGILKEEGKSNSEIEAELDETFGAADYSDFINKGLEAYPSLEQIQELNDATIPDGAGEGGSDQGVSDQEGEGDTPDGITPGTESSPNIRPDDADVPGDTNPYGLEESEAEHTQGDRTQQKELGQDPYVRRNLDLRQLPPVEMTPKARSEMNAQAFDVLERIKTDPASFTNDDRLILRQYTGQGGLDLAKMAVEDRVGALNQHYTSYQVTKFAWNLLESMGVNLKGAEALEPTAGIGNFAGMAPRDVKWRLNEVDQLSGEILGKLYPEAESTVMPFESYVGPKKDLVITNVPFLRGRGKYAAKETDARYSSLKNLHDYVIMKSIDQLNDNGIGVMITSTWTMDKNKNEFRKQMNLKAEVVGAIRIPMGAFSKNTQYAGSADMIIFRKRTAGEMQNLSAEERLQKDFVDTIPVEVELASGKETTTRSKWFEVNRSQAIGEWKYGSSKGGLASSTALNSTKENFEGDLQVNFNALIEEFSGKYVPSAGAALPADMVGIGEDLGSAKANTPKFGLEIKDGVVAKSDQYGRLRAVRTAEEAEKGPSDKHLEILVKLMETAQELRENIAEGNEVKFLQDRAKGLLDEYSALPAYHRQPRLGKGKSAKPLLPGVTEKSITVKTDSGKNVRKKVGFQFKHNPMLAIAGNDNRYSLIRFLYNKEMTGLSDVLTKTPRSSLAPEPKRGNMATGMGVKEYVMAKFGVFRTADAREEWKGDPDDFDNAMMAEPDLNRHGEEYIHDRDYLVGNLREKLEFSEKHNLKRQVEKIRKALPEQRTAETVNKNPISTWWSKEALSDFAKSQKFLGQGQMIQRLRQGLKTKFRVTSGVGKNIEVHNIDNQSDPRLQEFVEVVLNQRNAQMVDPKSPIDKPRYINDFASTVKIRETFQKQFSDWASTQGRSHAEKAAQNYNENFASKAVEEYSQEDIFIKNVAPEMFGSPFKPFPSQLSAVRMVRNQGGGILAHDVGNGKTLAAIFAFAEQKQAGKAKKGVVVAPAGTLGMWESNFNEALQGMKVKLVRGAPAAERRADLMDAAANDYDVILISHDAFKSVPLRRSDVYINEEIKEAREAAEDVARNKRGDSRLTNSQLKGIEARIGKLESKLEVNAKAEKDALGGIFYEDLGADMLIIDEAHNHKNVFNHTNEYADKRFLKIGGSSSNMADDMVHKTRYTHEINNRGNVLALTATPTPNSILEIYSMLKLVAPWEWEQRGINSIDDFIRNFIEIGPMNQSTLSGTTADKEGVIGFKNGAALNDIVRSWVDYKEATPESQKGLPESEKIEKIIEPTDEQLNMLGEIAVLDGMNYKTLQEMGINPVTLTTRAKALAVDPAFENPALIDEYPSFYERAPKLREVMDDLKKEFEAHPDRNHAIFLQQYMVRDWKTKKNSSGENMEWPAGFGKVDPGELEKAADPSWMRDMTHSELNTINSLIQAEPVLAEWDESLLDKNGIPKVLNEDSIEKIKPFIDEETGKVYIQEKYVRQNLHEEMKKFAINVIGMDPDRVMIVNGKVNNKPADKTRMEDLSSLGKLSLIIGNSVMSEGLNLQEKGNAILTADVPWEPKSVTQQNGRMLRSRKDLTDKVPVKLYNYALRYSADRKLYEILERKREWNRELNYGNWDVMDNSINNNEVAVGNISDELEVPVHIVEGFKTKFQVTKDAIQLREAKKHSRKAMQNVEKQQKNFAEAVRKIENAEENIRKGQEKHAEQEAKVLEWNKNNPDKPKKPLPEPYDGSFHMDIIKRNTPAAESGQKFIDEAMKNFEPFAKVEEDIETNNLAQALLNDAKRNNWHSINDQIDKMEDGKEKDARQKTYTEFLHRAFPVIAHRYPRLADMAATAIVKDAPFDSEAALEQVQSHIKQHQIDMSQAGFSSLGVMGAIAAISGSVAAAPTIGPVVAVPWVVGALGYAGYKLWRTEGAKVSAWSIKARLREMDGFERLEPLITHATIEQQRIITQDEMEFKKIIKGLDDNELLLLPDYIEGDIEVVPPHVQKAAEGLQKFFERKSLELQKAELDIPPDPGYFPRMLKWDMMQKMKEDTDLLTRNAISVVNDKNNDINNLQDAYSVLLNMFDGSAEMRQEKRSKETEAIINSIVKKHPEITYNALAMAMARSKNKYGLQMSGNIKYGRRAPRLLSEMYHRDPRDVMRSYIPGVNQTLVQKKYLQDGNNNAVNQFLNRHYPVGVDSNNDARDEVKKWFNAELGGHGFSGKVFSPNASRNVRAFQYWTKLGLPVVASVYAPVKNVLGAFNLSVPLAGGRNTMMGAIQALGDATSGFSGARSAGAIAGRVLSDIYGSDGGIAKTSFQKLAEFQKEWGTFGISEKFVRSWAFYSGRNMADRLYKNATEKNSGESLERLKLMIGEHNWTDSVVKGGLTESALDQAGVFMSNKIGGKTSAFDMAGWMNTTDGRVLMQFHSMAFVQTTTFKNEILMPAWRDKDFGPLLRWGTAVGISTVAMVALTTAIANQFGGEPPEEMDTDNPAMWAWHTLMLSNMVFATGLYGDLAAGLDSRPGTAPYIGTMTGPTLNSVSNAIVDIGSFTGRAVTSAFDGEQPDDPYKELKGMLTRELPGLNMLKKTGNLPAFE